MPRNTAQTEDQLPPLPMPAPLDVSAMDKVLVFVPHPDDESIGCGGLIAHLCRQGTPVHLILVSDASGAGGLPEGAGEQRIKEFRQALKHLGSSLTQEYWRLPDGGLHACDDLPRRIQRAIDHYAPTTLVAPWLRDLHTDHSTLGRTVLDIAQAQTLSAARELIFYEVWSPLPATHVLDISGVWPQKKAALACHKIALSCGNYLRAMESLAAYRSLLTGAMAAEGHYAEAYRCIGLGTEKTAPAVKVRYAVPSDGAALARLFQRVFGQQVPDSWWQAKYAGQPHAGSLAQTFDGEIVAYYGAMHRQGIWQGQPVNCAQQADVMVAPEHRFATRSQGVFSRISKLFLQEQLGQGRTYQLAYGFPTERALQLGVRLGLYRQADMLGYWVCDNVFSRLGVSWQVRCQPCHQVRDWQWVDRLQPFTAEPQQTFWLKKTASYWQQRYCDSPPPGKHYHLLRLYRWGRIQSVAIVRLEESGIEILDLAKAGSHPDAGQKLISAVINEGVRRKLPRTTAWGTHLAVTELMRHAESLSNRSDNRIDNAGFMALPSSSLDAPLADEIQGRCWMLGGDTDFR
ncbi:GNAT family N-acetyltransferase [Oceanospirillum linum]|uniref:N-acetylglucosaminylphosphatidylinositol deacetylase n=1 Tax=Oceanospirillum linum TaxID=966 RepID=A0A1T1HAS8_OCELI|nr:GNAT family N-acetyltransferase [Oceanospirillum linum]OOV86964.1 hypothetical protein BTA35_0208040 [Oceanospirillum linum]SEF69854.1 N-acetylglucosaminyl deacetylase, LmbE family [Oleiphilus messinensis]SMP15139.1 N-acetylglucosaminyl deacetylase, LmbE family [Oceanospirillum linum]